MKAFGRIDILVNNPHFQHPGTEKLSRKSTPRKWRKMRT